MSDSKNDIAWNKLFEKYSILDEVSAKGYVILASSQINEFREARLMTKFDHKSQLPKLFKDNHLSILPISRGNYILGLFETFHDFNKEVIEVSKISFPLFLESLNYKDITSESTAINCAFVSKILHDFTNEEELLPTVNGRMSSSSFSFTINSKNGSFNIDVDNSQIEIDGGYEGSKSLYLIEAKNYISDDFLIRQLFYPYKLWENKLIKTVTPIFLTYTNGIFHLREYSFDDNSHYNSLQLVKEKRYSVQDRFIDVEVIEEIVHTITCIDEPEIPFPQANSFERVINLCELLKQKVFLTKDEITENYDFDARQTDYYINAGKYLGLIISTTQEGLKGCVLSDKGTHIFSLSIIDRQIEFIKLILSHSIFNRISKLYLDRRNILSKEIIVQGMKECNLHNIKSEATYLRRASTVLGWVNWIFNLTNSRKEYTLFDFE